MSVKQGEIYIADLDPVKGSEQSGKRPVVVISGNTMNGALPITIVCPITSQIKNYYGCVQLKCNKANGLRTDSEIITFQVRTVTQCRLVKRLGKITKSQIEEVHEGINQVLTL